MKKIYFIAAAALALTLPWQSFARRGAAETGAAKSALAVVAIPAYVDTTGSQNYGYLSGSLTDAVNSSMQQKFDYARANQGTVDAETKKTWKPNKMPSDPEIRQIAAATGSDYVVVGSYSLSANKKQIIFSTRIFIAPNKFINAPPFANNADATLFDATNQVATEIVKAIEADALQRASANQAPAKKEGEKIALEKAQEPSSSTSPSSDDRSYASGRYIGVGVAYATNTVERHQQYYQYASPSLNINADFRITHNFMIYGRFALPQMPSGGAIPATYQNKENQTVGFEVGDRTGDYVFGMNYRNFSDVNPGAVYVRDLLGWSASAYMKTHFHFFTIAGLYFGLDFDSYLDFYSAKAPNVTANQTKLLWNIEGAFIASYLLPVVDTSLSGIVGGAFSLLDSSGQTLTTASGLSTWDTTTRNGIFTGLRLGLELEKRYRGVSFKLEAYTTPSVAGKFQPLDEQNVKKSSYSFVVFSVGYRFGF